MFPNLSGAISINSLKLKNRLIAAPTVTNWGTEEGGVNELTIDMYRTRSRGGWGLVVVEASSIRREGRIFPGQLSIYNDTFNTGLNKLAETIKENGAAAAIQLFHGGRAAIPGVNGGFQPVAPSSTTPALNNNPPHGLSLAECEEIIADFGKAALRAQKVGFDMVLLHAANGMLIQQFLSPFTNHRKDKYGDGKRFLFDMIKEVRSVVGPDYPVGVRLSGDEFMGESGYCLDDMAKMVPHFVDAGADLIDVSGGARNTTSHQTAPLYFTRGHNVYLAEEIKKVCRVPVVTAGRIMDPRQGEDIVKKGRADLVAFSRGMLADPDLPNKAFAGRLDDIRMCLACDMGCIDRLRSQKRVYCAVNYEIGRHRFEYEITPSTVRKKVLVIGGGPAGLEAARVAALRDFEVTLTDNHPELGGTVRYQASAIPRLFTHELRNSVKYLSRQVEKLEINIQLETYMSREKILQFAPDIVIEATGARFTLPDLPGIGKNSIAVPLNDYLERDSSQDSTVAIVGGQHGCELAVGLKRLGKRVILVDQDQELGLTPYIYPNRRALLLDYLKEEQVEVLSHSRLIEIDSNKLIIQGIEGTKTLEADTVVIAAERIPAEPLVSEKEGIKSYRVGDCLQAQNIMHAIHAASNLARSI